VHRQADRQAGRQAARHTDRHADRQADKHKDKQAGSQAGIQTDTYKTVYNDYNKCYTMYKEQESQINSHWVSTIAHTVVFQITKELHSENAVQRHEEQEEDGNIVDLLA
jgi:hypothetical protein